MVLEREQSDALVEYYALKRAAKKVLEAFDACAWHLPDDQHFDLLCMALDGLEAECES